MSRLILASSSTYRRAMLKAAGLEVVVRPPWVDETAFNAADPERRALDIARAKAAATTLAPDEIGIAADQVIYDPASGEIFGKPASAVAHRRRLRSLAGREHRLFTAFVVWNTSAEIAGVERAVVRIRGDLSDREIADYVATGDGSGCAGGYTAEGAGSFMIEAIEGDWFTVIGLPLYRVHGALRELGRG